MSYFAVILIFWILIASITKFFDLKIVPKRKGLILVVTLFFIFVIPGFLIDWIAISEGWYIFPKTTKYLLMTHLGVPIEEALFFVTVPMWIIVLWKFSRKVA